MKRTQKTIIAIILVVVLTISLTAMNAFAEDRGAYLRRRASEAAEIFREMGYPENSAAIRICQLAYADANGQITRETYLHDSTTGQKYYLLSPNTSSSNGYGYSSSASYWGEDYFDGQYYWYFDSYYQKYYRFERDGSKTWMSKNSSNTSSTGATYGAVRDGYGNYGSIGSSEKVTVGSNTYAILSQNIQGYNYTYKGIRLYSGRIYGLQCSDWESVNILARLINSYVPDGDLITKGSFGWQILDLGEGDPRKAMQYYAYDANAYSDWDMEEFAKELLFRYQAEQAGNSYVGRILPEGYGYITTTSSSTAKFSKSINGEQYWYPDLYSQTKSKYHSPY